MPIRVLSETVIDQIAAGEVLERPAHLIKELIENSLDAGATEIEVEFDDGGRRVCVRDNGSGISQEDLPLSVLRHATSKIVGVDDLFALRSYGFRGEALASIAAVSRLTMSSKTREAQSGFAFVTEFGSPQPLKSTPAPIGTCVNVEDLFANMPARLKFLKSDSAESSQIKQVLKAMALARPDVQFRVRSKGELQYFWSAKGNWIERAEEILGVKPLFEAHATEDGIEVRALWAAPDRTLQQNRGVWIFAQGRWIQDRALTAAVMESYRSLLMHGEYPQVALFLQVPESFVDVNVHPAKSQVKFQDSSKVFRAVVHTLRGALEKAPWLQRASSEKVATWHAPVPESSQPSFHETAFSTVQYQKKVFPVAEIREVVADYRAAAPSTGHWSQMEVVGQAHSTYIVAQSDGDFYLIDQHAAHERIVFERLMDQWRSNRFDVQTLLLPLVVDFSHDEAEILEKQIPHLAQVGLTAERMGPESVAITAIPSFVTETAIVKAVKQLAHELLHNGGSFAWERRAADVFASMACHSVVRAGQILSIDQMKSLLVQMDEFPLSTFCPHGRPVSLTWSFAELERKFGRIV